MNKMDCNVIADLLPLYVDGVCSKESVRLVEEHLKDCESCRNLYQEMSEKIPESMPTAEIPEWDAKKSFRNVCRHLLGVVIALAAIALCFACNAGGAWLDVPAGISNLCVTILYIIFWGLFSVMGRKYAPFIRISFVFGLLTFIFSGWTAIYVALDHPSGEFAMLFTLLFGGLFAGVPFYGFRMLLDYVWVYALGAAIAAIWTAYAGFHLRKNLL